MSFHSVTMSEDEASRELKAIKLQFKDMIALAQASSDVRPDEAQAFIARYQRKVDALKLALFHLGEGHRVRASA
jgi:hypothetical protein